MWQKEVILRVINGNNYILSTLELSKELSRQYMLKTTFLSKKIKLEVGAIPLNYSPYELIA